MRKNNFAITFDPAVIFLSLALVFGFLFLIITPPFQSPDEPNHFFRIFQISEGRVVSEKDDQGAVGGLLPKSLRTVVDIVGQDIKFHPERKQNLRDLQQGFQIALNPTERVFLSFPNTALYTPVPYLPQMTAIFLGTKFFQLTPLQLLYMGRIASLILYVGVVFLALKTTPIMPWTMALVALNPMSLFLAASLSADGFTNALIFLLIALFLLYGLEREKKLTRPRFFVLIMLCLAASLAKQSYLLLPFLFLLIPQKVVGSRRRYISWLVILVLINIAAIILWSAINQDIYQATEAGVEPVKQFFFTATHPFHFLGAMVSNLQKEGQDYLGEFIGQLGWLDTHLNRGLKQVYGAVILFVALTEGGCHYQLTRRQRLILVAVGLGSVVMIFFLLYLSWTPVAENTVYGVQGRYFIAIAPLLLILLVNPHASRLKENVLYSVSLVLFEIAGLAYTSLLLLERYYG